MKSFTAGPNENGVRLSRFVEGVTKDMPRSMMYKAFRNKLLSHKHPSSSMPLN